uniref:SWI/SNF-related matrix-associated actin-dependent regulator of chromatin subfamily A containing DEAD/H box 1 homolog n=1 Tax=Photinus pyralis TaxID=7054 RepID=A0A1Y1NGS1_PHOPY
MSESDTSPSLLNLKEFRIQKKSNFSHTPDTVNSCLSTYTNGISTINPDSVITPNTEEDTNGTSRLKKSDSIIEKEKQMRFLRERYPSMESMAIHDVLSKHNFNVDNAIKELQTSTGSNGPVDSYANWKVEQEKKEAEHKTEVKTEGVRNAFNPKKRSKIGEFSNTTKKKAKRMRTEAVSDESDVETNDYKDRRVFDSDEDSDVEISNHLTSDKKKVLEFFNTAIPSELQLMATCSKKKADVLIEFRPFNDWVDLVQKLQENKNLNTDLLNAAQEVLLTRRNIQRLMKCCKNLAQQMERAVAKGAGVKQQPALLDPSKQLTGYQMVGLNWLAVLHKQGVNGILADEMGLGKTIQVIAFLAHLKETGGTLGIPHLIVVPSSTLDNWRVEFERWCPELKVFMYYGTTEERKMYRIQYWSKGNINQYDVILTTYSMVTNSSEERKMFKVTQMHYVIFDEAHMLKNMNTQRYENLIRIKAKNRILLTGTPLQNNLLELMSLLIFVMPDMFAGRSDDLKNLFQKNSKVSKITPEEELPAFEKDQIKHAKDIMKPFLLRRLKQDVLQDLPQKTDELVVVPFPPTQLEQYNNLVYHFQSLGKEDTNANSFSAMTVMSDLRKLSNHPLLLKYFYEYEDIKTMAGILARSATYKETNVQYITEDLLCMSDFEIHTLCKHQPGLNQFELPDNLILTSGKFLYLDKKLDELKRGGHRVLIFSQYVIMLNVMEEYLTLKNYSYLRLDGSTPVTVRQELIDQFTNDPDIFIFLLSTKAGGLGINLTAADTVIIHDIDFNPYNDKQAEDRCHRMGQLRPVNVYRLISKGTIEEGMWQMNQEKLKLEKEVTANESENPDVKSVVRLLSSVLGIDSEKINALATPPQTNKKS